LIKGNRRIMRTLAPIILVLAACTDTGTSDSATATDSGTLDTEAHYEEGCIKVDGAGGYKYLADALKVANDGSTITLCEGVLEESVTITRSVFITGPSGADLESVTWSAPSNQVAAEISGAVGVGFSGFSVESTRSGFKVDSASDVSFIGVDFTSIEGTAIQSTDTTDLLVQDCTFLAPQLGGIQVDGGTADVERSVFDFPLAFAVKAVGGATVSLSDSTITGTFYSELDSNNQFSDGFAFWGTEDSTLISTNNVYTDNLAGLWGDEANVDSSGDTVLGGLYGAYCVLGSCDFVGDTFTDNLAYGIIAANQGDGVLISGTDISGDPETVYNDGDAGVSVGLLVQADGLVEITDATITGHNYTGMQAFPWNGGLELVMTRVDLNNNGRNGLYMADLDATLTDVNVDNLREVEDGIVYYDDGSALIQHGFGVAIFGGSAVSWNGGGARDSELINVLNFQSTLVADGIELAGGSYFGLWNIEGDLTFQNGSVTRAPYRGAIMSQYGAAVTVTGNSFADSRETYLWTYDVYGDGTYVYDYYYYDYSTDISSIYDGPVTITGNTFSNGSTGIEIYANTTDAEISDNHWQDYNQQAIYVSSQSSSSPVIIENNTFERIGAYAIYCSYGVAQLKDITVDGVTGYRSAAEYYINGEYSYSYDYTYYRAGIYSYACEFELNNVTVADSEDHAIQLRNSDLVLIDVSVTGGSAQGYSSDGSLLINYDNTTPNVLAQGITVTDNAVGAGLVVRGSVSYPGGTVQLSDVSVSGSAGDGIVLETLHEATVELEDVQVNGAAADGLRTDESDLVLDGATIFGNTGAGLALRGNATFLADNTLTDVTVYDNLDDGLALAWANVALGGLSTTNNSGYGLVCTELATFTGCDGSDLSNNAEGAHCGCENFCAEAPGPLCPVDDGGEPGDSGDTGPDDTGGDSADPDTGP